MDYYNYYDKPSSGGKKGRKIGGAIPSREQLIVAKDRLANTARENSMYRQTIMDEFGWTDQEFDNQLAVIRTLVGYLTQYIANPHIYPEETVNTVYKAAVDLVESFVGLEYGSDTAVAAGKPKKKKNCKKCGGSIFETIGKLTNMFSLGSTPLEQLAGPELTSAFKNIGYNMLGEHLGGKKKVKKGGADGDYPAQSVLNPLEITKKARPVTEEDKQRMRAYAQEQQSIMKRQMPILNARDMRPDITPSISGIRSPKDIAEEKAYKAQEAQEKAQADAENAKLEAGYRASAKAALERKKKENQGSGKYKRKGGADADSGDEQPQNVAGLTVSIMPILDLVALVQSPQGQEWLQDLSPAARAIVLQRIQEYEDMMNLAQADSIERTRRAGARTKGAVDKKPRKVSKWVIHVKSFALKHNLTYPCAMSNAQCKAEYKNPPPKVKKRLIRVSKLPESVVEAPKPKKRLIRKPKTIE